MIRDEEGKVLVLGVRRVKARWNSVTSEAHVAMFGVDLPHRL